MRILLPFTQMSRRQLDPAGFYAPGYILHGEQTLASGDEGTTTIRRLADWNEEIHWLTPLVWLVVSQGELRYHAMPPVGQAVILFGKTERLRKD